MLHIANVAGNSQELKMQSTPQTQTVLFYTQEIYCTFIPAALIWFMRSMGLSEDEYFNS